MLKSRPLLLSAIIFGGIGLLLICTAAWIFVSGDTGLTKWLSSVLHSDSGSISSATFSQLGIVFEISAMVIACRALDDESGA